MKEIITQSIQSALNDLEIQECVFSVDCPNELGHGDYATNVALVAAEKCGRNPQALARETADKLKAGSSLFEKIEVAGPGFINFFLGRAYFSAQFASALPDFDKWSANNIHNNERVIFEYTSPNLFKPLHIGNLVGNIIGESISRLLENAGAHVYRVNYPSDIGLSVAKGVWGLLKTKGDPANINNLGEAYRYGNEKYETDQSAKEDIERVNRALYAGFDESLKSLRTKGIETSRKHLAEICTLLGTKFDQEILESEASEIGRIVVEKNTGSIFKKSEGATVFEGEPYGLHTRVFLNSQGLPTYEAKDLGNFALKNEKYPNWTASMIVTGNEQTEYFKVLFAAIRALYPETKTKTLKHIPTGFLTLTTGKMSSRKGNILSGEVLIEEARKAAARQLFETRSVNAEALSYDISVAALKYQILKQKVGSNIVFDQQRALSFEGDSGPYLQYTHARICSVLEKAAQAGVLINPNDSPSHRYEIESRLLRFPDIVEAATIELAPHKVLSYLTELASAFNAFYAKERIADKGADYSGYKMAITKLTGNILQKGLRLLGIVAPEKM